jgi:hypothetical protein
MELRKDFSENQIVLVTMPKERYNSVMPEIQEGADKSSAKIGYITINKPFNSIIANLAKININKSKFYFVDAITATVEAPPIVDNCFFVSSPTALTDISLAFSSLLSDKACDIVVFDTISTLGIYQDLGSVVRFAHNLITKVRVTSKRAVFIALKEDSEVLIKDLNMFVDKIIDL